METTETTTRQDRHHDEHKSSNRSYGWVVERTLSWLTRLRRLKVRDERRAEIHRAFLSLGCALICWKQLQAEGDLAVAISA
jgi:transposase